jgi:hypothetical protein
VNSQGAAIPSVTRIPSKNANPLPESSAWLHTHAAKKASGGQTTT